MGQQDLHPVVIEMYKRQLNKTFGMWGYKLDYS